MVLAVSQVLRACLLGQAVNDVGRRHLIPALAKSASSSGPIAILSRTPDDPSVLVGTTQRGTVGDVREAQGDDVLAAQEGQQGQVHGVPDPRRGLLPNRLVDIEGAARVAAGVQTCGWARQGCRPSSLPRRCRSGSSPGTFVDVPSAAHLAARNLSLAQPTEKGDLAGVAVLGKELLEPGVGRQQLHDASVTVSISVASCSRATSTIWS